MTDYLSSLDKLLTRNEDRFWPTHGAPIKDPLPYLTALIEHRLLRIETIRTLLELEDLRITDMVPQMYPDIQPELHSAAGLSTLASIQHLERLGEVQPIAGSGSDTYFRFLR
jgi:glyoxylase-like metal-dependent hydrolase (beta-lactamase superfamily II)